MSLLVGVDPGLTLLRSSTGVAKTQGRSFVVEHTTADLLSRLEALDHVPGRDPPIDVLAIDAPVLPFGVLHYDERACEKLLVWGPFQRRCKVGESHVDGTGRALRRAGCDTARQLADLVSGVESAAPFPRVQAGRNVVEAFPNAFLGVLLPEDAFPGRVRRGRRSDLLFERCHERGVFRLLQQELDGAAPELWDVVSAGAVADHDERAAVACLMTAVGVHRGRYVAAGEPAGGYLFLPPWPLWSAWARHALDANRRDPRLLCPVEVWIDGVRFERGQPLPPARSGGRGR